MTWKAPAYRILLDDDDPTAAGEGKKPAQQSEQRHD